MDVLLCLFFVAYLFPFAVAARHDHDRLGAVLAVNLLLGWTVVGWWVALWWARHPAPPPPEPVVLRRREHLRLIEGAGAAPVGDAAATPKASAAVTARTPGATRAGLYRRVRRSGIE
jgi:hypothetical protein